MLESRYWSADHKGRGMARIPKGYVAVLVSEPYVLLANEGSEITSDTMLRKWDAVTGTLLDAKPQTAEHWLVWMPYARPYSGDGSDVTL